MSLLNNSKSPQFNRYKFIELSDKLLPLLHELSDHQKQIGIETLEECCWSRNFQDLSTFWQQHYCQPKPSSNIMPLLHYNIRYFYSNQVDLIGMVNVYEPVIISLNVLGTIIPDKNVKQLLFSHTVFTKEGTNPYGGVVIVIDMRLKCELMDIKEPNIIAARVIIEDQQFVVANIYSPPTDSLPLASMSTLLKHSKNIIIVDDLNTRHPDWDCSQKSVEFSAITEKNVVHRSSEDIVTNLAKHFTERHDEPLLDMTKTLDKEARELWQLYSTGDKDDIKLISNRSDLRFSEQDITDTIRSLKSKNSSGFDQVSNKMIKEIPEQFHVILTHAYNQLFSAAH
ncbi:unnamed protein product [Rotaria socialis]|uniref:Endonuclease/exonuclease/phosphatase domain-containing protein n=1 Tax=Rotaria socialis TaxID=392032 RepID=A0A820BV59_9BILA|nr:unnamed protein product [Rotaria socialis]CAF4206254.1 unnamed protein product [Rotaria socialis]